MAYSLKSHWRFPYNFTRDYLRPSHYIGWVRHIYQRARYGVSDADIWSLDYYLAHILIRALPSFLNSNSDNYHLNVLNEDRKKDGYWDGSWTDEERNEAQAKWDTMILLLIARLERIYGDDQAYETEEDYDRMRESLRQFADHFGGFWV